jgi:hypothetical protein
MQWFAVILTGTVTFAYIVFKIYKTYKNKDKDKKCTGCAYSDKCAIKQIKNTNQVPENQK